MIAPWPHGDPRVLARAIVADPRFHGTTSAKPPPPSLWDLVVRWIGERMAAIFTLFDHLLGANNPAARTLGIGLIVAAVALVAWLVFRLVAGYLRSRPPGARTVAMAMLGDDARSSSELAALAATAARDGRLRDAARLWLTAAMRLVDECGIVPFDAARTPGEYQRLVRREPFDRLARAAVEAVFGEDEPDAEILSGMHGAYDALRAAVGA
jgi:hypothetical protein